MSRTLSWSFANMSMMDADLVAWATTVAASLTLDVFEPQAVAMILWAFSLGNMFPTTFLNLFEDWMSRRPSSLTNGRPDLIRALVAFARMCDFIEDASEGVLLKHVSDRVAAEVAARDFHDFDVR